MRKLIFSALVVLCATLNQGLMATTAQIELNSFVKVESNSLFETDAEIDSELVEQIIRYIQQEYDYDYQCLCDQYANGEMTIEKDFSGYLVTFRDGGALIGLLIESL